MGTIQVKDREFEVFLKEEDIQKEIKRVAADINRDYVGKEPLFLCILNGSFMFAADLLKNVSVPCNVSFVKVASYQGTDTTGKVKELMGLQEDVEGRHVIIVEDIVDTPCVTYWIHSRIRRLHQLRYALFCANPIN